MKIKKLFIIPTILMIFSCAGKNTNTASLNSAQNQVNNNTTEKVKINFDANGGKLNGKSHFKVDKDTKFSSISNVPNVTREGCSPNPGWYYKDGSNKVVVDDNTTFSQDRTLLANWSLYNVTFNSGLGKWKESAGESKVISNTSYLHKDDIEEPTYAGGKFLGWYKGDDKVSFPYTPTEDVTLTAKYDVKQVSIFLNAKDGYFSSSTEKMKTIKVPYGTTWAKLKENSSFPKSVNIDGDLIFDNWKLNGIALTDPDYKFTTSTIINASYEDAVSVTFDIASNGGKWVGTSSSDTKKAKIAKSKSHTFADYKTAALVSDSKGGKSGTQDYDLLGWFNDAEANGTAITDTESINSSKTVYAYYKEPHTITFNCTGCSVVETTRSYIRKDKLEFTVKADESYSLAKSDITVKWNGETKTEGEDKDYTYSIVDGVGKLVINEAPGYDITATLAPLLVKHKVTLVFNDDAKTSREEEIVHGKKISKPTDEVTKEWHTSTGKWYSDSLFKTEFDFENTAITSDITLYAKWDVSTEGQIPWGRVGNVTIDGTRYYFPIISGSVPDPLNPYAIVPSTVAGKEITAFFFSTLVATQARANIFEEIILPESVKLIGYSSTASATQQYGFTELKKVNLENVEIIYNGTFGATRRSEGSQLTSINLKSCTSICDDFFNTCVSLSTIESLGNITELNNIFEYCPLTSINIPKTLTGDIVATQFASAKFESITVDSNNEVYTSKGNDGEECNLVIAIATKEIILGCSKSKIPDGIETISDGAFSGTDIKEITIPASVKEIGANAFNECAELETVNFADKSNCTKIGDMAFYDCKKLKNVNISSNITSIGYCAFGHCENLEYVKIPDSVTSLGKMAFTYCYKLKSVDLGSGITSLPSCLFQSSGLESITIGKNVTDIDNEAFNNCKSLNSIIVDKDNPNYTSTATIGGIEKQINCVLTKDGTTIVVGTNDAIIPDSVTTIGECAYWGRGDGTTNLTDLPSTIKTLEKNSFTGSHYKNIDLKYVTDIKDDAFEFCQDTVYINLHSIVNIGIYAFSSCPSIKEVYIGKTITNIGGRMFYNSFTTPDVTVKYEGTEEEWANVTKAESWNAGCNVTVLYNQSPIEF